MPIPIEDYATPSFIRLQDRFPMSYNKEDKYNEICPRHFPGRYPGEEGREGGWKQAGYNPNHQSTRVERIKVRAEDITLRAR